MDSTSCPDPDAPPGRSTVALAARGLGKYYPLEPTRLSSLFIGTEPTATPGFWVLRDVSFALAHGASIGIIGRNGAGKSTLLRMLAGVARPTAGHVERAARVACLLDLGIGFHPLETGRDNAMMALVLQAGLTRREARARMPEIEDFAELGPFFDRPIRTYSDGMRLRLAFSTITVLEPEVLVTDEILAVGDQSFQERCNAWFDRFLARGGGLVLCSHELEQIQRLCDRTVWLEGGGIRDVGDSRDVVRHYREAMGTAVAGGEEGDGEPGTLHAAGQSTGMAYEVVDLRLEREDGGDPRRLPRDATVLVTADVHGADAVPQVFIGIVRADRTPVYGVASDMEQAQPVRIHSTVHRYRLRLPRLALTAGTYWLRAHALDETGTRLYDTVELGFEVDGDDEGAGLIRLSRDAVA